MNEQARKPPYLTDEEIAEITRPLRQGAARIKFFRRLGMKVEPKPNGQPLVWRADFEAAGAAAPANDARERTVVDWSQLKDKVRGAQRGRKAP